jgi:signal peptidase II
LLVVDQFTKSLVQRSLSLGESVPVLGDFFRLTYIHNAGGAFGITFGHPLVYFLASGVIAIWILAHLYRRPDLDRLWVWGLVLVLSGALGNLIDRVSLGQVVDFLDFEFFDVNLPSFSLLFFRFPGYSLTRWPVFNVADSCVTVGVVALLVSTWLDPPEPEPASAVSAPEIPPAAQE